MRVLAVRKEALLHETEKKYRPFHILSFFTPSVRCFCAVSYADAVVLRKSLPADSGSLDDIHALCFRDTLKGKDYITYIYLKDGNLTELFTVADSQASASAGTSISQLSDFQAENLDNGFYRISLKSATGISAHFLLHSTAESSVTGTDAGKKEAS